jgi:hypothetical protein
LRRHSAETQSELSLRVAGVFVVSTAFEEMSPKSVVSFKGPGWNRGRFVADANPSVMARSVSDIELIVRGDDSTNGPRPVVASCTNLHLAAGRFRIGRGKVEPGFRRG